MTRWLRYLALPILGVLGAWVCDLIIVELLPSPPWHISRFVATGWDVLALLLGSILFVVGIWMHHSSASTSQLLSGLITPALYWGLWAWLVRDLEQKDGFFIPAHAVDYAEGSAPLLGVLLGYTYSVLARRLRSSV